VFLNDFNIYLKYGLEWFNDLDIKQQMVVEAATWDGWAKHMTKNG